MPQHNILARSLASSTCQIYTYTYHTTLFFRDNAWINAFIVTKHITCTTTNFARLCRCALYQLHFPMVFLS
jgi:hypothetical protein